jgi:hypothetical protein
LEQRKTRDETFHGKTLRGGRKWREANDSKIHQTNPAANHHGLNNQIIALGLEVGQTTGGSMSFAGGHPPVHSFPLLGGSGRQNGLCPRHARTDGDFGMQTGICVGHLDRGVSERRSRARCACIEFGYTGLRPAPSEGLLLLGWFAKI